MNKKIILIIVILIIIIGGIFIYRGFIREEPLDFRLEKVFRGDVYQEIVETGVIRAGEEINLSFKGMGRIEEIGVEVGDLVKPGQILAKIDDTQLLVQISEARAGLKIAEAGLARLEAGASEEEIQVAQINIRNNEISLRATQQKLKDVKSLSEENLSRVYQNALNSLRSSYLDFLNNFHLVRSIQERYFTAADQEGIRVRDHKAVIRRGKEQSKSYLEVAENNPTKENIDRALLIMGGALSATADSLSIIRQMCEVSIYKHKVSDADRNLLDANRININRAHISIINSMRDISFTRINNENNINVATSQVSLTEGALEQAQNQLILLTAQPREVDIALHQAQIDQARARKTLLERQIQESVLRSPIEGKITEITKETGEIVQPVMPVISLLPIIPFQVEVNIYEEDVAKIKMGNTAKVEIIAFPGRLLRGTVASINPTEILIGDVVHYKTTIVFVGELPEGIRPGMTADIVIQTALRENVLIVFEDAIQQKDDRFIVEIYKDGLIEEREIGIGLKGEDNKVELISGLKEGEEVIIR